jgi:dUTP pyrophosphatase
MQIEMKILDSDLYPSGNNSSLSPLGYATLGACAIDLRSAEDVTLMPGERKKIKTGIAIHTGSCSRCTRNKKHGVAALILPRSGLGTKGLVLANTVGLIDQDYQGELIISAWNSNQSYPDEEYMDFQGSIWQKSTDDPIEITRGDRIAQLMFTPIIRPEFKIVEEFSNSTERGEGGFNSTGDK